MTKIELPTGQIVYNPRGTVEAETRTLAARVPTLDGLRVGVLDNSKWNASTLLRHAVGLLEAQTALGGVRHYTKPSFSRVAPVALLDQIARETDVVITAVGD